MKRKDVETEEGNTHCTQHPETCSNPFCIVHS